MPDSRTPATTRYPTDEERWKIDGERNGWKLPWDTHWTLRLPVVRHIRSLWHAWHIHRHYLFWNEFGLVSRGYDEWVVYAIRRGWA